MSQKNRATLYMPRLNIWVIILAILTSTLGIAGSITIFISLLTNASKQTRLHDSEISSVSQKIPASITETQNERISLASNQLKTALEELPKKEIKKEIPIEINKPVKENKVEKSVQLLVKPIENKNQELPQQAPLATITPKPIEKILPKETEKEQPVGEEKIFDEAELEQLLSRIKKARQEYGIIPNCVQINTSKSGNNKRATSQIESYLRSRKYSIAGKETTSSKFSGIQIKEGNDCLQVLIGSF